MPRLGISRTFGLTTLLQPGDKPGFGASHGSNRLADLYILINGAYRRDQNQHDAVEDIDPVLDSLGRRPVA